MNPNDANREADQTIPASSSCPGNTSRGTRRTWAIRAILCALLLIQSGRARGAVSTAATVHPSPEQFSERTDGPNSPFDPAIQSLNQKVVKLYGTRVGAEGGYGSGILISAEGRILTVLSILIDASQIRVVDHHGNAFTAHVLFRDERRQLALLQIDEPPSDRDFAYFELDPERRPPAGEWVVAGGNPFRIAQGSEANSITHGICSGRIQLDAVRRSQDFPYRGEVIVIDGISNNPGFAGGGLVDLDGRLVGLVGREVRLRLTHTNLNYALPNDVLVSFLADFEASIGAQDPEPPTDASSVDLGIRISRVGYRKVLPFVERVIRNSPAARAGLRADDLIMSLGGRQVSDLESYDRALLDIGSRTSVDVIVRRNDEILAFTIDLTDPEEMNP